MENMSWTVKKRLKKGMNHMIFADDMMKWEDGTGDVQIELDDLNRQMKVRGLNMSKEKSEVMATGRVEDTDKDILLGDTPLKFVDEFTYLGTVITNNGRLNQEISRRLEKGRKFSKVLNTLYGINRYHEKLK